MAASSEFRLPNTPPQGFTFPPTIDKIDAVVSAQEVEDQTPSQAAQSAQHRRNPSHPILSIDTGRARSDSRPSAPLPPPPARTNAVQAQASVPPPPPPRSSDLPLRQMQQQNSNRLSIISQTTPVHQSIFPRYNPAAPLAAVAAPRPSPGSPPILVENTNRYSASMYSTAPGVHTHSNSLSEAFAVSNDPVHAPLPSYRESMMDMPAVIQSSASDVLDLWLLASGQDDQDMAICYNLGLECVDLTRDAELICLTSTSGALYTLHAKTNDLNVIRTHPINGSSHCSIATPNLYEPTESNPLLTTIFPVLSKLRAMDDANSISIQRGLQRADALALEREAITRAHQTTAAPLVWNPQVGNYYLPLPVVAADGSISHHTLPVEIAANQSIRVLEPFNPRSSHTQSPILTFSIPTKTLIVHAPALVALPSPYAADILLSAMMALLLHLHRTTSLLTPESDAPAPRQVQHQPAPPMQVPTFAPPPLMAHDARGRSRSAVRSASRNRASSGSRSRGPSRLGALLHPSRARSALGSYPTQQESQQTANHRLSTYSTNSGAATLRGSPPLPSSNTLAIRPSSNEAALAFAQPPATPGSLEKGFVTNGGVAMTMVGGTGNSKELTPQGTAPELDVRNTGLDLSRFQTYDLADPRLGAPTRLMLRVLYWQFGVAVWILGACVGIFAEVIVLVTTCGSGGSGREG